MLFQNILNDIYTCDLSRKLKGSKYQLAKQGLFISVQTPYGYPRNRNQLIIDPEAAAVVRIIFSLAESGMGSVAIAAELKARWIVPHLYINTSGEMNVLPGIQR